LYSRIRAAQVLEADAEVDVGLEQPLTCDVGFELASRAEHELGQTDRSDGADRLAVKDTFDAHEAKAQLRFDAGCNGAS
jgi:hypothetical protein